jgi:serine/threonine protein kinase
VTGFEEHDGKPCLVMELVEGENLGDVITRRRMTLSEALRLFREIAEALAAAHVKRAPKRVT